MDYIDGRIGKLKAL